MDRATPMNRAPATALEEIDAGTFGALSAGFADRSYLQSAAYMEVSARKVGARVEYLALREHGAVRALAALRVKAVPGLGLGVAYLNGGPLVCGPEGFDANGLACAARALRWRYVEQGGKVLRVAPPMLDVIAGDRGRDAFLAEGFAVRPMKSRGETFVLDLRDGAEAVRRRLDPKWRSDLVKGERAGLRVTCSESVRDLDLFAPMLATLETRKGFAADHGAAFYREVQARAAPGEGVVTHLAWVEDEPVAGHVGDFTGACATYLLGAGAEAGNAARASYLLQWSAIEHAIARGCAHYDLGGVDAEANPGVYRFKKRMGGRAAARSEMFVAAPGPLATRLVDLLEQGVDALRAWRARARAGGAAANV